MGLTELWSVSSKEHRIRSPSLPLSLAAGRNADNREWRLEQGLAHGPCLRETLPDETQPRPKPPAQQHAFSSKTGQPVLGAFDESLAWPLFQLDRQRKQPELRVDPAAKRRSVPLQRQILTQRLQRTLQRAPLAIVRCRKLRRDSSADHQADHGAVVSASTAAAAFVPLRPVATAIVQNATTKNVPVPLATALTVGVDPRST